MTNVLASGVSWLAGQLAANASQAATYTRGAQSCPLTPTLGSTEFETVTAAGAIETVVSTDFIVAASALVLGGVQSLPQRGDTIALGAARFQVMAPAGKMVYQLDAQRVLLRIHTKQVG